MECLEALQSWQAFARRVIQIDTATSCGVLQMTNEVGNNPLDCDTVFVSPLEMLNHALRDARMAAEVTVINMADLCDAYRLRSECPDRPSLLTMTREAFMFDGTTGAFRVALITGQNLGCTGCNRRDRMLTRLMSSFVTGPDGTYVLVGSPASGSPDALNCDTVHESPITMVTGAIEPVGSCGMWAWKSTIV